LYEEEEGEEGPEEHQTKAPGHTAHIVAGGLGLQELVGGMGGDMQCAVCNVQCAMRSVQCQYHSGMMVSDIAGAMYRCVYLLQLYIYIYIYASMSTHIACLLHLPAWCTRTVLATGCIRTC
jgi:hypothetical protein